MGQATASAFRGDRYHTIVVGAGPGGLTVAIGLAGFGRRVALVEAGSIGGDCTNVGCVPSKALLHASEMVEAGRMSRGAAMRYVHDVRDRVRAEDAVALERADTLESIAGRGRISGRRTVEVHAADGSRRTLTARHVVLATGSSPARIIIPGLPDRRTLTNESIFELPSPPSTLAIVGGGAVGSELALAFCRLGTRVTLVEAGPRLLPMFEPAVGEAVAARLAALGVQVLTATHVVGFDVVSGSMLLHDGRRSAAVETVLVAAGRRPNTAGLGLEALGVDLEGSAVVADSWGRTTVPWLHAVGDVTGTQTSTAAANAIGRRLVRRLALPLLPGLSRPPLIPAAVYTDPEVASVGPTLAALRLRYPPELVVTRRIALAGLDRAKTDGLGEGFLVVHALRIEGRILSATWVAPHAADMLPVLSLAIQKRVSLFALTRLAFPYPSLAASLKGVAEEFLVDTLRELRRELLTYLRYRFRPGRGRRAVQQPEKRWASARKGETHEWK